MKITQLLFFWIAWKQSYKQVSQRTPLNTNSDYLHESEIPKICFMGNEVTLEERAFSPHKERDEDRQWIYFLKICTCNESIITFCSQCEICFKMTGIVFSYLFPGDWNCTWEF